MKHLFVPYELALKLKEKGFDEPCFATYFKETKQLVQQLYNDTRQFDVEYFVQAPLYQQVIDWFREKHEIHIKIIRDGGYWMCTAHDFSDEEESSPESSSNTTNLWEADEYYEALNKAIEEALKLI